MALIYHDNVVKLFNGTIMRMLGSSMTTLSNVTLGITVYSGAQPTAAQVAAAWSSYNSSSSNYLVTYTNSSWSNTNETIFQIVGLPTAQTPLRAGTASWAIIWNQVPTTPQLDGATLPKNYFMVVPVSDTLSNGVIRFSSLDFTTSSPVSMAAGSMQITF